MRASTLCELIRFQSRHLSNHLAYVTPTRNWSYSDVDLESSRLAQGLGSLGIGPGDRVGCLTKHTVEYIVLVLACAKLGAVCAPYNWRLAAPELEYVINLSEARILLADKFLLPTLTQVPMPNVMRTLVVDATNGSDSLSVWRSSFPAQDVSHVGQETDTVLQLCSSGTTGLPKAVDLSHLGLLTMCERVEEYFGPGQSIVQLNVLPTFHVMGTVFPIWSLFAGAMTVADPEFVPENVLAAISKYRVNLVVLVPAMLQFLLRTPGIEAADLSSLKTIGYGGSPIGEQLLSDVLGVFGCDLVQVYGATEVSGMLTALSAADHRTATTYPDLLRSAGKAVGDVQLRIVNPGTLMDVGDGEVGEIWARTRTLMNGYFRNESATRDVFPEGRDADGLGGWYRTGDAGYLRDGYLYINDRVKDMVISGGENIYPAEVENVVLMHPAVSDVAVIGVPDALWGEAVKACVVLKPDACATEQEIIEFTRARLAHYKCPKSIDFVNELPRNPTGKLLKRVLRQKYWPDNGRQVA